MSKNIRYETWGPNIDMVGVVEELQELYDKGWIVVSHNQGVHGMSVILIKHEKET